MDDLTPGSAPAPGTHFFAGLHHANPNTRHTIDAPKTAIDYSPVAPNVLSASDLAKVDARTAAFLKKLKLNRWDFDIYIEELNELSRSIPRIAFAALP